MSVGGSFDNRGQIWAKRTIGMTCESFGSELPQKHIAPRSLKRKDLVPHLRSQIKRGLILARDVGIHCKTSACDLGQFSLTKSLVVTCGENIIVEEQTLLLGRDIALKSAGGRICLRGHVKVRCPLVNAY